MDEEWVTELPIDPTSPDSLVVAETARAAVIRVTYLSSPCGR
jgi:hypothetical protein